MLYEIEYAEGNENRVKQIKADSQHHAKLKFLSTNPKATIISLTQIDSIKSSLGNSSHPPNNSKQSSQSTTEPPIHITNLSNASIEKLAEAISTKQRNHQRINRITIDDIDLSLADWFKVIFKISIAAIPVYIIFALIAVVAVIGFG